MRRVAGAITFSGAMLGPLFVDVLSPFALEAADGDEGAR